MNLAGCKDASDVPLSLISKFCDSRLEELSNCPGESLSLSKLDNFLYANVLSNSSAVPPTSSYIPKRREHSNSSLNYISPIAQANVTDFADVEAQQLTTKRNLVLTKHLKAHSIGDFIATDRSYDDIEIVDLANYNDDQKTWFEKHTKPNGSDLDVKERLESYLPSLTKNVLQSRWAHLKFVPSLYSIISGSYNTNVQSQKQAPNSHPEICVWDFEQGLPFLSSDELMVLPGLIDKPHSIRPQRLKKHFDQIGVTTLPLQSMATSHKFLYLQDGSTRIRLSDASGKLKYNEVVSGIAVAVIGKVTGATLHVEDVIFATACSPEWPLPLPNNIEMVFLSGLFVGSEGSSNLALDLLQDYLLGLSGSAFEQKNIILSRSRLFILGNVISTLAPTKTSTDKAANVCARNMERLDSFLEPLLRFMEVFLLPGERDPTFSSNLPQPPFHPKLLPESSNYTTLKRLTNPARLELSSAISQSYPNSQDSVNSKNSMTESSHSEFLKEDVHFIDMLLQSGKNIKDTMDYCDIYCPITMAKMLLSWAHFHPTYCDTNSVLAQNSLRIHGTSPHLVVIGNLSEFKCIESNGTKIVGVPSFHKSHTAVVVTKDFDVMPLSFKCL